MLHQENEFLFWSFLHSNVLENLFELILIEADNGVLWKKIPKEGLCGKGYPLMATDSAVMNYNEGFARIRDVF